MSVKDGWARLEVVFTLLKKSIFEPQPNLAKEQLLAIPLDTFEGIWPSLIVPAAVRMASSFVTANFHALIDFLFALIFRGDFDELKGAMAAIRLAAMDGFDKRGSNRNLFLR